MLQITTVRTRDLQKPEEHQLEIPEVEHQERAQTKQKRSVFLDSLKAKLENSGDNPAADTVKEDAKLQGRNTVDPEIRSLLPKASLYIRIHKFFDFDHRSFTFANHIDYLNGKGDPNKPTLVRLSIRQNIYLLSTCDITIIVHYRLQ